MTRRQRLHQILDEVLPNYGTSFEELRAFDKLCKLEVTAGEEGTTFEEELQLWRDEAHDWAVEDARDVLTEADELRLKIDEEVED